MSNYYNKIKHIYPLALDIDFQLQDNSDGKGLFINHWNTSKLGAVPTLVDLDTQVTDQEILDIVNEFPNKKIAELAALGNRAAMRSEVADINSVPALRGLVLKLADIVYSNHKGTID